ncbi:MAG: diaminopimelate epimerase [Planctomycetota bacterium]|nr:diaminopimelate epimerase [Planctomycetota bacterium]
MNAGIRLVSGTGNRFAILDAITNRVPTDPAALARVLCSRSGPAPHLDGLLLVLPPRDGGNVRMQLHNADGSTAETCGNGLRCVAKFAFERGLVAGRDFVIEDLSGLHAAHVEPASGPVQSATVSMRKPRILARDERVEIADAARPRTVAGTRVDVGNPHFVLVVEDVARAPVTTDGPRLEKHAAFPAGTNVEFVARRGDRWEMRVWERGVGETEACGSGACAVGAALADLGLARLPIDLHLPGGVLRVAENADGSFALSGAVLDLGERELPRGLSTSAPAG